MHEPAKLLSLLTEKQLIIPPITLTNDNQSPWFIKVLLAIAGWLAALFCFGFFAITLLDLVDNNVVRAIIGVITIFGAFFILKAPQSEFFEHIGLAVSLNGQALIGWALFDYFASQDTLLWAIVLVLQSALAWLMPSFLHRLFSTLAAAFALSLLLAIFGLSSLFSSILMMGAAWLWLHEFRLKSLSRTRAIAYGITLGLIAIKASSNTSDLWPELESATINQWIDEGLNCLILLYISWQLLQRYDIAIPSAHANLVLVATLLLGLASLQTPGVAVAMMLIILGYSSSHATLMGLGTIAGLFYLSKYYYSLELSLNEKALSLALVGVTLIAMSKTLNWWLSRGSSQHE
ncbi:DUF4401 domain-containing protein [Paraglaciecola sp.]|uniref:DUF4401 domain-containing protein n=1 Tax=Pseudomonadati TaxID=3379134 RepID=UPI00273CFE84|nr:DUF4401 domain-containing protein [Paraglaciecola sp.]MDP5029913.1 DUF4401 domain-containing protein [Paraglaciecola sp.]